jgi:hypothetical protein
LEPSRDTAGRRRRELLALSRELDETGGLDGRAGPDSSLIVYDYGDGWTVRRILNANDQHREGVLLRNCLVGRWVMDTNLWSLRDRDNLPHLAFACWCIDGDDDLSEVLDEAITKTTFLRGSRLLLMVDTPRGIKDDRRLRLQEFADCADVEAEWFPQSTHARVVACARGHNVSTGGIL